MSNAKDIFKLNQAQTFPSPSCLEIEFAKGAFIGAPSTGNHCRNIVVFPQN